jgi:outer membrane protein assembly factor BamD (BamD/ComL family)
MSIKISISGNKAMNSLHAVFSHNYLNPFLPVLFGAIVFLSGLSHAGTVIRIDADAQFDFAEHYFLKGEYSRAADEYKRFAYFFPDDRRVGQAMYQCGMAFYSGRQYEDAAAFFNEVISKFNEGEWAVKSHFMLSESHIRMNQFGPAVIALHNLIALTDSRDIKDEAYYRLGWISIDTASWDDARENFEKIDPSNREKFRLQRLSAELAQEAAIPRKSPALAGVLSLVPGGGQLYCERYQDALIAFLLNGALIWASYEAFDNDNHALGVLLTFFEVGFYAGNIYGAVGGAHKYNRTKTEKFIQNLKENTKIDLSGNFDEKSVQLSLRLAF